MKTQINNQLVFYFKFFSKALAILVFFIGFLALLGWQFEISLFKRVAPSLPVIAPNTSFSFLIVGFLIIFLNYSHRERDNFFRKAASFFSLLVAFLGFFTLTEYVFGINFRIDNLLFAKKMGANIIRMSPQSALNFLAVGLALFLYSLKNKRYTNWGQFVILVAGITALVSLIGFIYGVAGFYTISPYKGMAAHTAFAFTISFLAILLIHPEQGYMKIFAGKGLSGMAARRLLLALGVIFLVEMLIVLGGRAGFFSLAYESLFHLVFVTGVFIFLIFYVFRSLDQLAEVEETLEHLKEVDRAKTEFVSLASHQLRTPLTSVSWFSEMLLGKEIGSLNTKQRDYLMEVYLQNRRMIELVDDLLNTSRIDMGMLTVDPRMTDLIKLIEEVLNELKPLIQGKNIQVIKNMKNDFLGVEVDPELMRIVFENLLSNAVKYTPPKGKISIELDHSRTEVEIKISDTGYGIPKNQQSKIFTKMFRADNIRDKVTDGTGLGLYIARSIIRQSGGKIFLKSEENKGTTFVVVLPIKKSIINKLNPQL